MKIFLMFILVLFGFSFANLEAKPLKKDVAHKEFVLLDKSLMQPKVLFIEEVAQPRKFNKVLSNKVSTSTLLKVKQATTNFKTSNAKNKDRHKPTIRVL